MILEIAPKLTRYRFNTLPPDKKEWSFPFPTSRQKGKRVRENAAGCLLSNILTPQLLCKSFTWSNASPHLAHWPCDHWTYHWPTKSIQQNPKWHSWKNCIAYLRGDQFEAHLGTRIFQFFAILSLLLMGQRWKKLLFKIPSWRQTSCTTVWESARNHSPPFPARSENTPVPGNGRPFKIVPGCHGEIFTRNFWRRASLLDGEPTWDTIFKHALFQLADF